MNKNTNHNWKKHLLNNAVRLIFSESLFPWFVLETILSSKPSHGICLYHTGNSGDVGATNLNTITCRIMNQNQAVFTNGEYYKWKPEKLIILGEKETSSKQQIMQTNRTSPLTTNVGAVDISSLVKLYWSKCESKLTLKQKECR